MQPIRSLLVTLLASMPAVAAIAQDAGVPTLPAATQSAVSDKYSYDKTEAGYALGYSIGSDLKSDALDVDHESFVAGIRAALEGADPRLSQEKMQDVLGQLQAAMISQRITQAQEQAAAAGARGDAQAQQAYGQQAQQMQRALEMQEQAEQNLAAARKFLEENKAKPDVHVTDTGLQYIVLEEGTGPSPDANDVVKVHYKGTLLDGSEFDSSYTRGEPAEFPVGGVIAGWTEALQKMKVGGKWKLFIPPQLAYGVRPPSPRIPPNSLLMFEVELLEIVQDN